MCSIAYPVPDVFGEMVLIASGKLMGVLCQQYKFAVFVLTNQRHV